MSIAIRNFPRPTRELIEDFEQTSVSTVHEAIGKGIKNAMDPGIKPIGIGMHVVGPAVTVQGFPADNITVHKAMTMTQPGDVLVINGYGVVGAMWGGQMTYQAMKAKTAGIVVDGAVRDSAEIRKMGFPCFARLVSPIGSTKDSPGSINIPITCGGIKVRPGDIVMGDDDGVVIVPLENAEEIIKKAKERDRKEKESRRRMDEGATSYQMNNFEAVFKEKGAKDFDSL